MPTRTGRSQRSTDDLDLVPLLAARDEPRGMATGIMGVRKNGILLRWDYRPSLCPLRRRNRMIADVAS